MPMKCQAIYLIQLIFMLLLASRVYASNEKSRISEDYISNIALEREQQFYEIFLISAEPPKDSDLKEVIFNKQLSAEFKYKYQEKFGQLDTESIIYQPTKFSVLDENRGAIQSVENTNAKRKAFGEYMVKRLSEWHIDNYFKTDPTMRPVYELKEKLSNVEVQVTKQTKINIQYSLSDNEADIVIDNPHFDKSKISLVMDSKSFGPGPIQEQKMIAEKQLDKKLRLNSSATVSDGILKTELIRILKFNWATSAGFSTAFKAGGTSPRETRYLVGLSRSW
jgi:hypothetical protein